LWEYSALAYPKKSEEEEKGEEKEKEEVGEEKKDQSLKLALRDKHSFIHSKIYIAPLNGDNPEVLPTPEQPKGFQLSMSKMNLGWGIMGWGIIKWGIME